MSSISAHCQARVCAFCGKTRGCFPFITRILKSLGGSDTGYAHLKCLRAAKEKSLLDSKTR